MLFGTLKNKLLSRCKQEVINLQLEGMEGLKNKSADEQDYQSKAK
jgi:hypothetical protein